MRRSSFPVQKFCHTIYRLLFTVRKVPYFSWITLQPQNFLENFCNNNFKHDTKSGNRESYLGNEGKDVKHQNIFTVNIISNIHYMITIISIEHNTLPTLQLVYH